MHNSIMILVVITIMSWLHPFGISAQSVTEHRFREGSSTANPSVTWGAPGLQPLQQILENPRVDLNLNRYRMLEKRDRSWWKYPLIGAAVGGIAGTFITVQECKKTDCIFPVGLPLVGITLGAAGGLAIEGIIRLVD